MATLFLWTVIAATGGDGRVWRYYDWSALQQFETVSACEKAIAQLGIAKDRARCVKLGD